MLTVHPLDVVVLHGLTILKLFAGEDQANVVLGNAFLSTGLGSELVDGVGCPHLESDEDTSKSLHVHLEGLELLRSCCKTKLKSKAQIKINLFVGILGHLPELLNHQGG